MVSLLNVLEYFIVYFEGYYPVLQKEVTSSHLLLIN